MKAPFPWFGGKSRAAHLVWGAFGDVANYVEPFAGSLAVLLARPHEPRTETVNDLDCYLANFWRAVQLAPAAVARFADSPVNEADLHARHRWLVDQVEFRKRMKREPEFFDARVAGWWVWGICQWIGGGWCAASNWTEAISRVRGRLTATESRRPNLHASSGVHRKRTRDLAGAVGWQKRPSLQAGGRGIHRTTRDLSHQIPQLGGDSGASGRGIHASALHKKLPKMDRGTASRLQSDAIFEWFEVLATRLRRVRVVCGDWRRVLGHSATTSIGVTGILFDPPYSAAAGRDPSLYAEESLGVAHDVREWCLEHGSDPKLRLALCGYEGEHEMPKSWQCVPWKAAGGYASAAGNDANSKRERIWFSPHCARAQDQAHLFAAGGGR